MADGFKSFDRVLRERVDQIKSQCRRRDAGETILTYIPTGLAKWDYNGGLETSILTVIGMETGAGKSMVKLHLARSAALAGFSVLMLDFEDPARKTADRALAGSTLLDSRDIGHLRINVLEEAQLEAAVAESEEWAHRVRHYSGGLQAQRIRTVLAENKDCRLTLIDYAQAVPEAEKKNLERTLSELAQDLQLHAEETESAVVVFSQLSPDVAERGESRAERSRQDQEWDVRKERPKRKIDVSGYRPGPGIKDLGWCKDLGRKAKCVVYGWRPGQWAQKHGDTGARDDVIEFIVDKANFNKEGKFSVRVDLPTARIMDMD